ncbi:hypothetical protein AAFF_G00122940 [Aldrovandia affinis]|uniref:Ig-like domain-containing protein n=1 Tax=Aldrovandia affinis TaxID=143900 RepID=A0AAD7RS20_9TELE|nr:hypothetical protein AAFF_G00122940 [Aldrovandia affinis]
MCGGAFIRGFLGLLFFGVRVGAEDCPIQLHPPSVVVRHGDPVSVNCTVSGDHKGIGWEASVAAVPMVTGVQFVIWRSEHLTDWNTGPRCYGNFVINEQYAQCQEKLQLIVYKTPDSVSISVVNHTGPMVEGEQYQLQCEIQNIAPVRYLTVKWYKGETLENQTSYEDLTKTPVTVSSTLLITPTSTDDGAQYSYEPRITKCLNRVELREGEPLDSISCQAKGNPLPIVTWYRDQSEFSSSTPLTRRDAGQYVFTATNRLGRILQAVNLTVGYRPTFNCNHTYEVTENENHNLTCTAEGYPVPAITWFNEQGVELELPAHLTRRHAGQYTLVANNTYGTERHTLEIEVLYEPRITECLNRVELREGEPLDSISCRAKGNPLPIVTWYRDQSEFSSSTPLTRRDTGQYVFTATNRLGRILQAVNLTVGYRPTFNCNHTYEVTENENHTLTCTAEGYPVPAITWFNEQGVELELPAHLTRRHAGQYTLVANNTYGTERHTLEIEVLYPPSVFVELKDHEVDLGMEVGLMCSSQGNPRPVYNWMYPAADNVQEHTGAGVSLLSISHTSKENNGNYSCFAWNKLGNVSETVRLTVRGEEKSPDPTRDVFKCPIQLDPPSVVVRHGDPVSVNCTVSGDHKGIGWEASVAPVAMVTGVQFVTWRSAHLTDWNTGPRCYGNFVTNGKYDQCQEKLQLIVYKTPDSVSISVVNHTGPMVEGEQYQLQCEIQNIAPVQYLTVKWYKGETLENQTSYEDLTKTPVTVSSTLLITPNSTDDGAQYSCVAELELGSEGPQPPPEDKSEPLSINVHYAATLSSPHDETFELTEEQGVPLNCHAQGNPPPEYSWSSSPLNQMEKANQTLITSAYLSAGIHVYTCTASNYLGEQSKNFTIKIIPIVDYLPLIAGIVAIAVVLISVAFIFIYSIYYKNTKMGQYNLRKGRASAQNGDVAQNGRGNTLPMKKLTKPGMCV